MSKFKHKTEWGLLFLFTTIVFLSVLLNAVIVAVMIFVLINNGILILTDVTPADAGRLLVFYILITVPIGIVVALLASKMPLKPIRNLIDGMDSLADGNFSTRINVGAIMRRYPPFVGIAKSFNKMAEHLGSTELLRSDFINNFSHEFKTPIVSIAGFAKLLRRGNLPEKTQQEYLEVIEEEALRLSYMATNVLNLTKIENQTILSDVSLFNLSEQIRSCILLLENKWAKKDLDFNLDMREYQIRANEELLKQVWINLLDNAVKFSPASGSIDVTMAHQGQQLMVCIRNRGPVIATDQQEKIFHKFYQCEESHAAEGNGVGLAIVKRVVELHSGRVRVESGDDMTAFYVELPAGC